MGVNVVSELGLDGSRVDAAVVEEGLDLVGVLHVLGRVVADDVRGGDDLASGELPDVQLVDVENAGHV